MKLVLTQAKGHRPETFVTATIQCSSQVQRTGTSYHGALHLYPFDECFYKDFAAMRLAGVALSIDD